jgi:FAD/FMN-containing dehydrogenase
VAGPLVLFFLRFAWAAANQVVDAWQHWAPVADRRLWSTCKLLAHPTGDPRVEVSGVWTGPAAALQAVLASFLAAAGAGPVVRSVTTRSYLDAMLAEAGCLQDGPRQCHLPPAGRLGRQPFAATSSMPAGPLPARGVSALVSAVERLAPPPGMVESGASLDALGGAVADVAPAATAFVHRSSPYCLQYTATWDDARRPAAPFDALVRRLRAAVTPYAGDAAYVNYCDAALADWATAYYGSNLGRLREVKRAVDPHGLFTFPQAVQL